MAQYTGTVSSWELPNFVGELYTAEIIPGVQEVNPTFLTLIGGLNGANARIVPDMNFTMNVDFDYPAPSQPAISEQSSITGVPEPVNPIVTPSDNTCQIYMAGVEESYVSMATRGRIITDQLYPAVNPTEGWVSETSPMNDMAAIEKQITYALQRISRDVNFTFVNGVYHKATSKADAAKTRGLLEAITTNAVDAAGAELSDEIFSALTRAVVTNSGGRAFGSLPILLMNATQKQKFSAMYAYPPTDRNIAGYNIKQFETDFGPVGVVYEPTIPNDTIILVSLSLIKPVFNPVPGKGILFYEPKAKVGASEGGMIYGHIGLDYGPEWMHGKITGLAV